MEEATKIIRDAVSKIAPYAEDLRVKVNSQCVGLESWQIIAYTFGLTLVLISIYNFIFDEEKKKKAEELIHLNFKIPTKPPTGKEKDIIRHTKHENNTTYEVDYLFHRMDLYWSWVPGLPRKLYWPVRVISWDGLKVKVFCKADNAILQFCSEYYSKSISDETDINENADDPMIDAGEPKDDEGVSKTIKSENCCIYGLKFRVKKAFFKFVKGLPIIKHKIAKEIEKNAKGVEEGFQKGVGSLPYVKKLPEKGLSKKELMTEVDKYHSLVKVDWSKGIVSGAVYCGAQDLTETLTEVYKKFAWTNPLHPDLFPDIRKMEAEVVRMCCSMFNGGEETCGTVTSGGTESILLACLAYRNMARERGIRFPEILVPITVHAAFDKAADFFHMKLTHIPVDPVTCKVDVRKMKSAINKNTCLLVGSAPQFPHGAIDDIQAIAALGKRYNIPVHTDCCLGGFLVPFMEKAGFGVPTVDFRVEGVTSISADTHKYGFAPKGSSVILYSDKKYRMHQFFVQPDWPGGIYASPTMAGSRSGAVIAACWASMMHFGEDGYVESTRKIITTTRYIEQKLREIPDIHVLCKPDVSVVAIGSKKFNIFRLSDTLAEIGWSLNPLQFPSSIHLCVTLLHTNPGVADKFIADVKSNVATIMKDPNANCGGMGAIYGMAQSIPDRSMVSEIVGLFLEACYSTKDPEKLEQRNGVH